MKTRSQKKQQRPTEPAPPTSQGDATSLAMASVLFPLDDAPTVIKTFLRDARRFLKQNNAVPPCTKSPQKSQPVAPIKDVDDLLRLFTGLKSTGGDVGRLRTALDTLPREALEKNGFPEEVVKLLTELMDILLILARNGSIPAAELLLESALKSCLVISHLDTTRPNLFKRAAPACNRWPVAWAESGWSDKGQEKKKLVERLKRLKFGSSHPQKQKGKSANAPAPGKDSGTKFAQKHRHNLANYANRMMRLLSDVKRDVTFCVHVKERPANAPDWLLAAAQLPAFDKHNREIAMQWFEVGYEALQDAAKGKIETLPGLKEVGKSARRAFTGEDAALDEAEEAEALNHERNGCKSRLREAFLIKFFEPNKG